MLTPKQRQHLKGLAHHLSPTVHVGRSRITAPLIAETNRALRTHELIKVKIEMSAADERRETATSLADATASELVGTLGKIAMLYRPREENPRIKLP
jgi:RNA-binding protein